MDLSPAAKGAGRCPFPRSPRDSALQARQRGRVHPWNRRVGEERRAGAGGARLGSGPCPELAGKPS